MSQEPLLQGLVQALKCLPGVGPKSAQRMMLHLLERDRERARVLADTLLAALDKVGRCNTCRTLSESTLCRTCSDPERNSKLLCVVESPSDLMAIENSGSYDGKYFVLYGHLSPIDGIGPAELGIDELEALVSATNIEEVIVATTPTAEGEATAFYLAEKLKSAELQISRIAHGVPLGGDLDVVDIGTITHAFSGRKNIV